MSKIKGLVLALLFPVACGATGVDELAEELARTAPMPCMDVAMPLQLDLHYQQGVDGLMVELGQEHDLASTWRAGNKYYDDARAVLLNALFSDGEIQSLMASFNGEAWARIVFRRGQAEELAYLRGFFKTPQGKLLWQYVLDGGLCETYLKKLIQSGPMSATPEHLRLKDTWMARLVTRKEEFLSAFDRLDGVQRAQFEKAWQLIGRLSSTNAPDEQDYQDTKFAKLQVRERQAYRRIYQAMEPRLLAQVEQFKAAAR